MCFSLTGWWRGLWLLLRAILCDYPQGRLLWWPLPCLYEGHWPTRPMGTAGEKKRGTISYTHFLSAMYKKFMKICKLLSVGITSCFIVRRRNANPRLRRKSRRRSRTCVSKNYKKMTLCLSLLLLLLRYSISNSKSFFSLSLVRTCFFLSQWYSHTVVN